jgi:hypothetical protein
MTKKKNDEIEIPIGKIIKTLKKNKFLVLGIIAVAVVAYVFLFSSYELPSMNMENSGSEELAKENLVNFASSQGATIDVVKTEDLGDVYEMTVSIEGEEVPLYVTKDGKYLIPTITPISE